MPPLEQSEMASRYDFFYLPMDVRNKTNVGTAFRGINTNELILK